jgi:hypothetical protein
MQDAVGNLARVLLKPLHGRRRSFVGVRTKTGKIMQVGPQRVGGEHLLPYPRRELMHRKAHRVVQLRDQLIERDVGCIRFSTLRGAAVKSF